MNRPRVAMVLSGGGAKAAAHIGAARALRDAGLVPVHWVATSMGAPVAAMLASGEDPDRILERFLAVQRTDVLVPRRLVMFRGLWTRAIFRAKPLRDTIARLVPARAFDELRAPLTVTAVEELTGVEVAFGAGGESAPLIDVAFGRMCPATLFSTGNGQRAYLLRRRPAGDCAAPPGRRDRLRRGGGDPRRAGIR